MTDFGNRLKEAMDRQKINASELSRLSGVGKNMISYYLNGKCLAKQDKIFLLARALHVDPGWLMTGVEPESGIKSKSEEPLPPDDVPQTPEARAVSYGMDSLPREQRELILNMVKAMFPETFKPTKGTDDDEA